MKLFLDTADIEEIEYFSNMGLIDGITTNPSLLAGKDYISVLKDICALMCNRPVSAEVITKDYDAMVKEGMHLRSIAENIVVKLPMTVEGLRACSYFASKNILTNMTLCFSATQALLAAKAGATYVSIFVGRLDDIGQDGMRVIADVIDIYNQYSEISSQVLVASVRSSDHVRKASKMGAPVCTIPPKIMKQLYVHTLTDQGLEKFLSDWHKANTHVSGI